jgi:hypothetical protein
LLRPSPTQFDIAGARLRIALTYSYRHKRLPDLDEPYRFTELVQVRKLHDRSLGQTEMADKIASKARVAAALGREWVIPLMWSGAELPNACPTGVPVILKARHGCNQNRVLRHPPTPGEWNGLRRLAAEWISRPYGLWLDEWAYRDVPRGVLLESLMEAGQTCR